MTEDEKKSYGKRPLWQWILLYLGIGLVIYGIIYYFVIAKKTGNIYNQSGQYPTDQTVSLPSPSSNIFPSENIFMTKEDTAKGKYLTDFAGMTLYTYDKDISGISNCYNGCAKAWPPYTSGATAQSNFPANISVIKRTDGSNQFAWKNMPLYYYVSDQKAGDITGDGVGGVWHIVKP